MTKVLQGRIHGKTIELEVDPRFPDGQTVRVSVEVVEQSRNWGDGIRRAAGSGQGIPDFDAAFDQVAADRNATL